MPLVRPLNSRPALIPTTRRQRGTVAGRTRAAATLVALSMFTVVSVTACADSAESAASDAATSAAVAGELPRVSLQRAFGNMGFNRPIFITDAGDDSGRLFVAEQPGRIMIVTKHAEGGGYVKSEFMDLRDRVFMGHNEEGLLGMAFHPKYATNGEIYLCYSAKKTDDKPRRGVLSRFKVSADDPGVADPASEEILLEVPQPWGNHNGATTLFGPDGYLYASFGDGGAANDPRNNAQNLTNLLGTVIRIDVNSKTDDRPYAVPADNPFVGHDSARPEIWAYGLRNVWRMSFDRKTGDLWAGDVGQNKFEEIDVITRGGNYGWRIREGMHEFVDAPYEGELIEPVIEYGRREGISVTGGYVYRGPAVPELDGAYIYADYVSGRIWALRYDGSTVTEHAELVGKDSRVHVASFGEGPDGELYICAFDRVDGRAGRIYKLRK